MDCVFGIEDNALIPKDNFEDTEDVFNGELFVTVW
jgi:hypothetical protein